MTELERLAGGLLYVGVPGPEPGGVLLERLRALGPGGVVLFARNVTTPDATRTFAAALRTALADGTPPAICVDQEGGRVARIPSEVPLPSMLALGAADDGELAERAGLALAATVRSVGADVAFAPVLDLALAAGSTVIGTRSLGDDAVRVAELGAGLVRGFLRGGVAPCPKHFPGHGATSGDSHVTLPAVETDLAMLRSREWPPFSAAFAAGAPAVMTAHVMLPALDAELPATLSARVLHGALRTELGFRGVCFTDCLEMAAVARRFGTARAGVLALAAGADALVVSDDLGRAEELRAAVVAAVSDGELPLARVEEAAARGAAFRNANAARGARGGFAVDGGAVAREIAARSIASLRGSLLLDAARPVTIVSFEGGTADGIVGAYAERPSLNLALRRRRLRSELLRVPLAPERAMVEALLDVIRSQSGRPLVVLVRRAHRYAEQREAATALLAAVPDALVISMLEPFDTACFPQARNLGCTFGDEASSVEALADVLAGRTPATAALPVRLPVRA